MKMIKNIDDSRLWMCLAQWLAEGPASSIVLGYSKDGLKLEPHIRKIGIELRDKLYVDGIDGLIMYRPNADEAWYVPTFDVVQRPVSITLTEFGKQKLIKHFSGK